MENCKKCNKEIDKLEMFSGNLCVDCYEIEYDKMPDNDKKPDFVNTVNCG